ncbi:MAG TPA: cell division protein FtsQ/DivIB [Ramlibacter sp.]|uniref:cell division protein FtsQ/DivIB n=1 Tax=Ramlibacter sp. TaxID=1917967 RepID=UPI002C1DD602|nr:cell division protein FtsQ/DivIB [Ramlibacter sp.]HVZ45412.1 cell division protein FtsQ/DivIB [Ramlibacter sp.]
MTAGLPTPLDVKLMNITASVLFAAFALLLAAAAGWWALRHQMFAIAAIAVEGDTSHNSVAMLRANVAPKLSGNFFTLDLQRARAAFEAVPWVRHAVVRRQFPNRLRVRLQEHEAAALWGAEGAEGDSRLVNTYGEVFEANVGDVEQDNLPRLAGPEGESAQVLAMYRALQPVFEPLDLAIEQLTLSNRGSWAATLDSGAVIELGRGSGAEVVARTQRFAQTLTQVTGKYGRSPEALVSADLRHTDGYAVRLRGVSTTEPPAKK